MTNDTGTERDYHKAVREMADDVINKTADIGWTADEDDRIHEAVDQSEWIIYYWRNIRVLEHTDNLEAYHTVMGETIDGRDIYSTLTMVAYFSMTADVRDAVERLKRIVSRETSKTA